MDFDRTTYQDSIFKNLTIPADTYSVMYRQFWVNQVNKNSLRLSKKGFVLLSKTLKLEYFTVLLKEGVDVNQGGLILEIDRKMTCPYYLDIVGELNLFGEKERTWLALNNDCIRDFLKTWA